MPRATRVQPDGSFGIRPARGDFMGNRGCLHDAHGQVRRRWANKAWITCTLREKPGHGPHPFPAPGRWTPLFFLDEAVACAAGHRPCAECRRAVFNDFKAAWADAFGPWPGVKVVDAALHQARIVPHAASTAKGLPEGAFILVQGQPCMIREGAACPYLGESYGPPVALPRSAVQVLTPAPLVAVMAAGWRPALSATQDRPNW